jgi:hypothetical protein
MLVPTCGTLGPDRPERFDKITSPSAGAARAAQATTANNPLARDNATNRQVKRSIEKLLFPAAGDKQVSRRNITKGLLSIMPADY